MTMEKRGVEDDLVRERERERRLVKIKIKKWRERWEILTTTRSAENKKIRHKQHQKENYKTHGSPHCHPFLLALLVCHLNAGCN